MQRQEGDRFWPRDEVLRLPACGTSHITVALAYALCQMLENCLVHI